ncbi:ImmA/IrrE family metallo-endopeptidase [Pseudomonas sp. yb_2]|uniref:ImmA/IrrE family metallo-endopeptidase n=1 Tax=Pseudomonas sp. yb_2 TaxID=3367218 RepID=UPI00370B3532
MNQTYIEQQANDLLNAIYRDRKVHWPDKTVSPIEVRDPRVAALVLGYDYHVLPNLGDPKFNRNGARIAGMIDRQSSRIAVSMEFGLAVQQFTGAHEIGHLLLHEEAVMHRDRALDGRPLEGKRPPQEREADYFAACFLVPQKLLLERFQAVFYCKGQFFFNDTSAYHLDPTGSGRLLYAERDSLERELALARCERFNGRYFVSLAQQFGVSDSAMALRIKELDLVRWP